MKEFDKYLLTGIIPGAVHVGVRFALFLRKEKRIAFVGRHGRKGVVHIGQLLSKSALLEGECELLQAGTVTGSVHGIDLEALE